MLRTSLSLSCLTALATIGSAAAQAPTPRARPLFDGESLAGWHGQRHFDPYKLAAMSDEERGKLRAADDATMAAHWRVENGELVNDGEGAYLTTDAVFGDAEYVLEYKTVALADSGIYLRGCPQVQIWDYTEAGGKWKLGADKGSGGLWNNDKHERFPPKVADKPFGEWNRLEIRQLGERVWVKLNGVVTVDGVVMENYWNRALPLPASGPLQLQTHGGEIRFRDLTVRELGNAERMALLQGDDDFLFTPLFDGVSFDGWQGAIDNYEVVDGAIRCKKGKGGNLFTEERFGDFQVRLCFRLPPGGNNGLAVRYPGEGDSSRTAVELQVLDDSAAQYATLKDYQYHGSVYGVVPAQRGYQRPVGEWNFQQVTCIGTRYKVELNGTVIVDADVADLETHLDNHTGKNRTEGFFGFCGHNDPVEFKDIRIRRL
ncbi:MAG: DUF1080 domain-containing protein [Planctomycetes bacterium]|nr:DUF1080 domain-containing protein [Planctomycetota bacterium]